MRFKKLLIIDRIHPADKPDDRYYNLIKSNHMNDRITYHKATASWIPINGQSHVLDLS